MAGGEFPVPIGQDNQGRITVEFKPFGVGLGFTPVVGRISLKISTEVSELSNVGSLQLNNTLTIPGLSVRRARNQRRDAVGFVADDRRPAAIEDEIGDRQPARP
ncbi:MAG: hypothetical protein WDN06_06675 [Asticcacaulis sp.]